jgi:hypothetical protein
MIPDVVDVCSIGLFERVELVGYLVGMATEECFII